MPATAHPTEHGTAREKILRAAIDLIAEAGSGHLTHRSVAERAGVSPGTTTYHFVTLDELLRAAFALYISDYEQGLLGALEERPLASRQHVARFLSRLTATSPETAEMARFELEMVLRAQRDETIQPMVAEWGGLLEARLAGALGVLGVEDAREVAATLLRLCRGVEFEVLARGITVSEEELTERLLDELIQPN